MFNSFDDIMEKGVDERGYIIWETEEERDQRLLNEWYYIRALQEQTQEEFPLEIFESK